MLKPVQANELKQVQPEITSASTTAGQLRCTSAYIVNLLNIWNSYRRQSDRWLDSDRCSDAGALQAIAQLLKHRLKV
jgi:hypothetical protein